MKTTSDGKVAFDPKDDWLVDRLNAAESEVASLRAAVLVLHNLWPAERWATLSAICRDHPCIDEIANLIQGNET